MLGAQNQQRLSIPADGSEGGTDGGAAVLRWQLLPIRDGHVPLPQLEVWTVLSNAGGLVMVGEPLPPPAIIGGTTVKVMPSDN